MKPFDFVQPATVPEVLELIADSDGQDVVLWAGGTATTLLMKQGLLAPTRLVGLRKVTELQGIEERPSGSLRLGAATRLRELERSPLLHRRLPCLAEAAAVVGNVRVRNAAMLGGHLAHADPAQDIPPLLLALDAQVRLVSLKGQRTVPLHEFFVDTMETVLQPNELLTEVLIPAPALSRRSRYVKYTPRSRDDYPTVGVACSVALAPDGTCTEARIAVGGVGPTPMRVSPAEAALVGAPIDPRRAREAGKIVAEYVQPWDDARGSAAYKRAMSGVWTERVLLSLVAPGQAAGWLGSAG